MPQKPRDIINEDGIDFAKHNNKIAKEKEADERSKVNNINFDYNAVKNIKR